MDNITIKKLYQQDKWTLRMIADKFDTNHHLIKRRLRKMGVEITQKGRIRKPFTDSHKKKISDSRKLLKKKGWIPYNLGLKMSELSRYKNMQSHLRFDVSLEWLQQFEDIEKLMFLNRAISNRDTRWCVDTSWYKEYVLKFYSDKQFNAIYSKWVSGGKVEKYLRPTIDHIDPKANKGSDDMGNLQFLTWFENRAKNDMSLVEWQKLKDNIKSYFI